MTVKRKDTHEYATGVFLLAGSEMLKLQAGTWRSTAGALAAD